MACVSRVIVGMFAALLLGIAPPLAAEPYRSSPAGVRLDAFDVEQVASLAPGASLHFSVFATPGAAATVLVEGVRRLIELREVQPGVYEGAHTIAAGDRVRAESAAVATVWRDGAVARATLEESLLLDGAPPAAAAARGSPPEFEAPGRETARSPAPFRAGDPVPPAVRAAPLPIASVPPRVVVVPAQNEPPASPAGQLAECRDCALVESIRAVEEQSGPAYVGAIAGGIFGAIFGDQIGKAHARHVTRVLGAVGGALLGRQIERSASSRTRYDASLRLQSGALRVRRYDGPPPFRVGETIRLEAAAPVDAVRPF